MWRIPWFNRKSKQHPQKITVPKIHFLGEQDGLPERELKERLESFFQRDQSVGAACLAIVNYEGQLPQHVALCVRSTFGEDPGFAEKVGVIFSTIFGSHEHLDIIFLDDKQESELQKVCAPFFAKLGIRHL